MLYKLEHFFQVDIEIKKGIYNLVPTNLQYGYEAGIEKYTNDLDDFLSYAFSELKCIAMDVFGKDSDVMSQVLSMEKRVKKQFYSCGFDVNKLKAFYESCISNMTSEFVDCVKKNCVGYAFTDTLPMGMATTLNEVLHFFHAYIVNNDELLHTIPLVAEKQNEMSYPIQLRGNSVDLFGQLFQLFPTDIDVGYTDMVAVSDKKLIMMVRDRGHALTIDITLRGNTARMEYFIPKLCNIDMINALPGVNKVGPESVGATGVIEVPLSELPNKLFDFISKVPMDKDMIIDRPNLM